jgi:glutaredoxin-like protein
MISEADKETLGKKLSLGMKDEVTLEVFVDEGTVISKQLTELATTLAGLSDKIKVSVHEAQGGKGERLKQLRLEHWPVLVLTKGDSSRIRYYGLPVGYELPAMTDAIVELSMNRTPLSPKAREMLSTVRRKANIKVFVLTTCPFCPTVAQHAFRAAVESPRVTSEVIDSSMFPDLAARHSVMGVPKIILNDNLDITGAVTDVEFFDKLRDSDHSLIDSMYG